MYIPKKENGRYQLRTAGGRLIMTAQHIEELEPKRTGSRVIWQWINGRYFAK